MSSIRQKVLAENIIKNQTLPVYKRKNKTKLVETSGYSKVQAEKKQKEIIESKGVIRELKVILDEAGLTEDLIAESLVEDIQLNKKKGKRIQELTLGAEILGMKKQQAQAPHTLQNIAVFIKEREQEPLHLEVDT